MARFRKPVVSVGTYVTRSGDILDATSERLQGWSDRFRQMRAERVRVPVSWGHLSTAEPEAEDLGDADQSEFRRSSMCAGHLEDLEFNAADQTLYAVGQAPGAEVDKDGNLLAWVKLPTGEQVRSAVSEVSIGVNDWRAGNGKLWQDVPVHLALCVLPVAHGLDGFQALATGKTKEPLYLSLALLASERAPGGGIAISGKHFRGGQFIPSKVIENASPEDKAKLAAAKEEHADKLRQAVGSGGPDHQALANKLQPHQDVRLKDHQFSEAKRTWAGIKSYHGDLALHRIHQLVHADTAQLENTTGPEAERLRRRLRSYSHMLNWHKEGQAKQQEAEIAKRTGVQTVPVNSLKVDPERFQYKLNTGKAGVVKEGSALEGVKRFRPEFAGVILVWHDPKDGKDYVVNGHHRHDLAKNADQKNIAVLYIDAKDDKEARNIGALANISEGRGTAVDAAKLIRDEGFTPEEFKAEGVSLKGAVARDSFVMANLSEKLFRKLSLGQLDEKQALAIGTIPNQEHQEQFAKFLEKETEKRDIPERVLQRMAQKITNTANVKTTEKTLFGEEESDQNLFLHRATLEAHALAKLSQEANLFAAVGTEKKAEQLKRGSNVLDVNKNREIADEAKQSRAVLAKLVDRKGPIADAFNEAAQELYQDAKRRKEIEGRLLDRVRELVKHEVNGGAAQAAAGGEAVAGEPTTVPGGERVSAGGSPGVGESLKRSPTALSTNLPPDLTSSHTRPIDRTRKAAGLPVALSTGAKRMADDPKKKDNEDDADDLFDEEDVVGEDESGEGDVKSDGSGSTPAQAVGTSEEDSVKAEIAQCLEEMGAAAKPNERMLDFLKHILTALKTHKMTRDKVAQEQAGQNASTTGANGDAGQATEEKQPFMMSTLLAKRPEEEKDPEKRALLLSLHTQFKRQKDQAKKERLARIDSLERRGMPKHEADRLRKLVGGYQLSLNAQGEAVPRRVDVELTTWAKALPGKEFTETYLSANTKEEPRPAGVQEDDMAELAKKRAERVSVGTKQ